METFFLYGTLKRGGRLNMILPKYGYIGEAVLTGYDMFDMGSYPAIYPSSRTDAKVHGELWNIPDEKILLLDEIESSYKRTLVSVGDKPARDVWTYVLYSNPKRWADRLASGKWPINPNLPPEHLCL